MAAFVNTIGLGIIISLYTVFYDPRNIIFTLFGIFTFVEIIMLGLFLLVFIFKRPPKSTIYLYIYNFVLVMIILQLDRFLS